MKRTLSLLLTLAMLASLLSGCGGKQEEAVQASPETEGIMETTEAPTTEPTLSPEEVLYNSLSDRMKQAVDVGIVELEQLTDLERVVTVGEASAMLQKAYVHRTGVESKTLNELMNTPQYAELTADRGWIFGVPGQVDMELTDGESYEHYQQWFDYLNKGHTNFLWWCFDDRLGIHSIWLGEDSEYFYASVFGPDVTAYDHDVFDALMGNGSVYGPEKPTAYADVYSYALKVYDSSNGRRFFAYEDGYINPTDALSVADAAEYALIFHNYPNPMEIPEYVLPEEVRIYNTNIITDDLLKKDTSLPDASCKYLPAEWHGVVMDDMQVTEEHTMHLDNEIYEYEIQSVKEAGFNFIGLNLDFSWLQDYLLFDTNKEAYKGLVDQENAGKLSLQRLEKLDQILAWCIEYDIHLNLRASALGSMNTRKNMYREIAQSKNAHTAELASLWQAVARRYANIPNKYLSFTLFIGDYPVKDSLIIPSVEAIRAESPDRCIIADICGWKMNSRTFAEMGVALSSRVWDIDKYGKIFNQRDYFSYKSGKVTMSAQWEKAIKNFTWPYRDTMDAEMLLSAERYEGESCHQVAAVAQEFGVGFMISNFGINSTFNGFGAWAGGQKFFRYRYPDEEYFEMIVDITSAIEKMGYGWCFANMYSPYGVAFGIPAIMTSTYVQVEDYPYYIDQGMMGLFQKINGAQ